MSLKISILTYNITKKYKILFKSLGVLIETTKTIYDMLWQKLLQLIFFVFLIWG